MLTQIQNARLTRRRLLALGTLGGATALLPRFDLHVLASTGTTAQTLTGTLDGADYRIEVPADWNGTLLLYSHGTVTPGQPNPALDTPDPVTGAALRAWGFALAGSAFRSTGYAVADAFDDQIALLDLFARRVGTPERTISWGDSQGGAIAAGLVQRHPERFAGALPMDGALAGGIGTFNSMLDAQFALKALLAPDDAALPLVHVTDLAVAGASVQRAQALVQAASQTPAGRARVALARAFYPVSASGNLPPMVGPEQPASPAEAADATFTSAVLGIAFGLRADVERRAGGNPCFNTGVSYHDLFLQSPQRARATALYADAGLDLDGDLARVEGTPRIAADPLAVAYLRRFIAFDGTLAVPVLTLHTTGDDLVPAASERAYGDVVAAAGRGALLRQLFVDRVGHGAFTAAERLTAFAHLMARIETGRWTDVALTPPALNGIARALGPARNVLAAPWDGPADPAFASFTPPAFPRAFDARTPDPVG